MNKKLLAALALACAGQASATDRSYTFAELTYSHYEKECSLQICTENAIAKGIHGSFELGSSGLYLLGSYRDYDHEKPPLVDSFLIDSKFAEAGVGYKYTAHPSVDVVVEAAQQRRSYESTRFDFLSFQQVVDKDRQNDQRFSLGTRGSFNDYVEGVATLSRIRNTEFDCYQTSYSAGIVAKIYRRVALTAGFERARETSCVAPYFTTLVTPSVMLSGGLRIVF